MAERVSLVFRNGPTKIDSVELDVVITESHVGAVSVTEHPVEQGANISDHAQEKPDMLTMTAIVSNTPISRTKQTRIIDTGLGQFVSNVPADQVQGVAGYAEAAYARLRELKSARNLITVVTNLRVYTSMIIENLTVPRDSNTGDALSFSVQLKQVIVVRNKVTRTVASKDPKAQPKAKAGKQATRQATEAEKKKSIAYSTAENLGLLQKLGIKR